MAQAIIEVEPSRRIKGAEVDTDLQIAQSLVRIAGFFEGTVFMPVKPGYMPAPDGRRIYVYHPETVRMFGVTNPEGYLPGPDLVVSELPEDKFKIEYGERIKPDLIGLVEAEIRNRLSLKVFITSDSLYSSDEQVLNMQPPETLLRRLKSWVGKKAMDLLGDGPSNRHTF